MNPDIIRLKISQLRVSIERLKKLPYSDEGVRKIAVLEKEIKELEGKL